MSKIVNGLNYNGVTYVGTGSTTVENYIVKVLEIGSWDMDTNTSVNVAHGLTSTERLTVVQASGFIMGDDLLTITPITTIGTISFVVGTEPMDAFIFSISITTVSVHRKGGGAFDAPTYDNPSMNRGCVMITYRPDA